MTSDAEHESIEALAGHFAYLDGLRESGITNMFGARPYLMRARKLNEKRAAIVLTAWMKSDLKTSPIERARIAAQVEV